MVEFFGPGSTGGEFQLKKYNLFFLIFTDFHIDHQKVTESDFQSQYSALKIN